MALGLAHLGVEQGLQLNTYSTGEIHQRMLNLKRIIQPLPLIIHLLQTPATPEQITDMLQANRFYIKTAVDIRQQILAGGGEMHSDCEVFLLDHGCQQADIWGASWNPSSREIFYESLVNLRPRQNRAMQILDLAIREQVKQVIDKLLGGL
jgi:Protein of unknown function (DUF5674)